MTLAQVERKLAILEREIELLKRQQAKAPIRTGKWYLENAGQFKDDPVFDEIVQRGRAYRESLRPKTRAKRRR